MSCGLYPRASDVWGASVCSPKQQLLYPFSLANISYVIFADVGAKTRTADTSDALPHVVLPEALGIP